jgi:Sulfotransferase family
MELISVHVPKCAGTSLGDGLVRAYGLEQIFFDSGDRLLDPGSPINVDRKKYLREFDSARDSLLTGKCVVHGHFCARKYDRLRAARFTMLREPLDRLISHYLFWEHLESHGHALHDRFLSERPTVIEFARMPEFRNFYREVMFLDVDMKTFDLIGSMEEMDQTMAALQKLIGKKLYFEKNNTNHCGHCRQFRADIMQSPQKRGALRDLLADEIEFYEKYTNRR